jgi:hypothetical protein
MGCTSGKMQPLRTVQMAELLQWLEGLKGGAPTVIGALVGSVIGFAAIVLGALFNARLNRLRDDNLRRVETRAIAAALRAELAGIRETLKMNSQKLKDDPPSPQKVSLFQTWLIKFGCFQS